MQAMICKCRGGKLKERHLYRWSVLSSSTYLCLRLAGGGTDTPSRCSSSRNGSFLGGLGLGLGLRASQRIREHQLVFPLKLRQQGLLFSSDADVAVAAAASCLRATLALVLCASSLPGFCESIRFSSEAVFVAWRLFFVSSLATRFSYSRDYRDEARSGSRTLTSRLSRVSWRTAFCVRRNSFSNRRARSCSERTEASVGSTQASQALWLNRTDRVF